MKTKATRLGMVITVMVKDRVQFLFPCRPLLHTVETFKSDVFEDKFSVYMHNHFHCSGKPTKNITQIVI